MTGASLAQYAALQSHNLKVLSSKHSGANTKRLCFPDKESAYKAGDPGSIPGLGRSLGEGKGYTPVFWPENSMDCIVQGVAKSWI